MNLQQLNTIGSGAYFPIILSDVKTKILINGKWEEVTTKSWKILEGDINLVKQNLVALINCQLGFRFRQENFGTRLWECLEEPNTTVIETLVKEFLSTSIANWEPRIRALNVEVNRSGEKLYIKLYYAIRGDKNINELDFEYNQPNDISYVY